MMVRGMPRDLLLGKDKAMNGMVDLPDAMAIGVMDFGWASLLTVHSSIDNVNAAGEERVDIQEADESALTALPGISQPIAKAIVAYRSQNRLKVLLISWTWRTCKTKARPPSPRPPSLSPPNPRRPRPPDLRPQGNPPVLRPTRLPFRKTQRGPPHRGSRRPRDRS